MAKPNTSTLAPWSRAFMITYGRLIFLSLREGTTMFLRRITMSRLPSVVRSLTIAGIVCTTAALAHPAISSRIAPIITSSIFQSRQQQTPCFASNADIAGIGVRVSTYAQSFLLFFTTFLCVFDGLLDSREHKALDKSYTNLLITACALLISAFVQAATSQLSIYHALLVLDWSWMLTANALILSVLPTIDGQIEDEWQKWMRSSLPSRKSQILHMLFVSLHLSLMGAFGVYVWRDPARLQGPKLMSGSSPDAIGCLRDTRPYVFFARIRVSNPTFRKASVVWYSIVAIPILNIALFTFMTIIVVNFINAFIPRRFGFGRLYRITWIVQTVMNIVIAVNTELTIRESGYLLEGDESSWGFGQILAVVLILSPIIESLAVVKEKIPGKYRGKMGYWFHRCLIRSEEPWDKIYCKVTQRIDQFIDNPDLHPNQRAHAATIHALKGARGFLDAANAAIVRSPDVNPPALDGCPVCGTSPSQATVNSNPEQMPEIETTGRSMPQAGLAVQENSPTSSPESAPPKKELERLWEEISKTCELRFSEVQDSTSFLAVKAYLKATRDALSAALTALDAQ